MRNKQSILIILLSICIFHYSCKKKNESCVGCDLNQPPIARAGLDQVIFLPIDTVLLDGTASSDPENSVLQFRWTIIFSPLIPGQINTDQSPKTVVMNMTEGAYQIQLEVTDRMGMSSRDTVQVTVYPPTGYNCVGNRITHPLQLMQVGTLIEPRSRVSIGTALNKIVFAGGNNGDQSVATVDIYDISSNSWSAAMLSSAREEMAVTTSGSKIFFGGGVYYDFNIGTSTLSRHVDIYDASTNTWTIDSFAIPRTGLTAATLGNRIFFAGGKADPFASVFSNIVDIYHLSNNSWSTTVLSEGRAFISAATLSNKVFFAGGMNSNNSVSKRIDIYDNLAGTWSQGSLYEAKAWMTSINSGNEIYWAGGLKSHFNELKLSGLVEITQENLLSSRFTCLSQPRKWDFQPGVAIKGNKLFFPGNGPEIKFDMYDISTNSWSVVLLNQQLFHASIISANNTIYLIGASTPSWGQNLQGMQDKVWRLGF